MQSATIIGLDTPEGAYLARLMRARGYRVAGSATDPATAAAMLATLGADEVALRADAATGPAPDEAYLLDGRLPLGEALAAWPAARVFVSGGGDAAAAARATGRFVAAGHLYGHVSRLDPPSHPVLATCAAVRDGRPVADDQVPRDLGWTPEYVDAMWRILQATAPADQVIASGVGLSLRDVAVHAAEYFRVEPLLPPPRDEAAALGDPSGIAASLGWRAFTHGRELVRALCEGLPA